MLTDRLAAQVDSQLFSDFKAWKEEPTLDRSCCFLERVYREDIFPCLTFSKSEVHRTTHTRLNVTLMSVVIVIIIIVVFLSPQLGSAILEAVEQNTLSVEPVGFQPLPVVKASAVECGGPK